MKVLLMIALAGVLLTACGQDKKNTNKDQAENIVAEEADLGLPNIAQCRRGKEITGSHDFYQWTRAEFGNLQEISIDRGHKTISYIEARNGGDFTGASPYKFVPHNRLYFKTTSKSLKLSFGEYSPGRIEGDLAETDYLVGILKFDDGSGFKAFFLCPQRL